MGREGTIAHPRGWLSGSLYVVYVGLSREAVSCCWKIALHWILPTVGLLNLQKLRALA